MVASYAPAVVSRVSTIKAVAEGVAPDFSDKPWTSSEVSDAAGLKDLAKKLNPVVGYWGAHRTGPAARAARTSMHPPSRPTRERAPRVPARRPISLPACATRV